MGVDGAQFAIVVALLLAQDVLLEGIVRDGKITVKELGKRVINGGTAHENLGVICIKIGVDHVRIAIDRGCIEGKIIQVLV
jgi:hypothetical protein